MRNNNEINLSVLWAQLLRIYKEIETICNRNGLRVYGIFGTQLGAVRHAGFIPWDDDLDLAMPREDYERFLSVAPKELGDSFSIVSWRNDPTYKLLFAKVIVTDAEIVKKVSLDSGLRLPQGLFVDIFPLDGCYGFNIKEIVRVARKGLYKLANYSFNIPENKDRKAIAKHFLGKMVKPILHIENIKEILAKEERLARQYPYDAAKYVNVYCWLKFAYAALFNICKGKGYFTRDMFGVGTRVPFESISINIPAQSEEILKLRYGDYMKLPPESQRVPMHSESRVEDSGWRLGPQHFASKPLLSIVIANYNYGRFIEDAILSIIKQCVSVAKGNRGQTVLTLESGDTVELIICDGGSTDNSLEIINKYSSYLTWWESCKDRGQSHAFNKGFSHANGKFLTWLNADDLMLPGAILKLVKTHRKYPDAEWVIGGCVWTDGDLKIVKCTRARKIQNRVAQCGYVPVYSPSSFFTKEVLVAAGGVNEKYHYKMDTLLWLQFYFEQNLRPKVLPGYVFCLRMHADAKVSGVQFCNKSVPPQHLKETEWLNSMWPRRKISRSKQVFAIDSYKILLNIIDTLMLRNKKICDAIKG